MWLVENWGVDKFRDAVGTRMGDTLAKVRPRRSRVSVKEYLEPYFENASPPV
jgi:sulfite reductase beta subunit-like hemoprotein